MTTPAPPAVFPSTFLRGRIFLAHHVPQHTHPSRPQLASPTELEQLLYSSPQHHHLFATTSSIRGRRRRKPQHRFRSQQDPHAQSEDVRFRCPAQRPIDFPTGDLDERVHAFQSPGVEICQIVGVDRVPVHAQQDFLPDTGFLRVVDVEVLLLLHEERGVLSVRVLE